MEIYFDGYCPESLIKGRQVEMRLNEDDFWESEATGLQITVFPPFATILRWRGKGKFKQKSDVASNYFVGLVMTQANQEKGKENFPDEKNIITSKFDLDWYLSEVYKSKEEFDAAKFNPNDPIFKEQQQYLNSLAKEDFQKLITVFDNLKGQGYNGEFMNSENFYDLHKLLYDLKIIFNFKWMSWHEGWENINNKRFGYSDCSLIDLCMYLTAIFRADRFNDGTIEANFKNGTLDMIFNRLRYVLM